MSLFTELKRRNVLRAGTAYLAFSWLFIQIVETLLPLFDVSDAAARTVVVVLAIGFIPVLVLAWTFELTADEQIALPAELHAALRSESLGPGAHHQDVG